MIEFINNMDTLRNELYNNSRDIIKLLEERREIAGKIGECKVAGGLKIRNREREIEILKSLSYDHFTEFVLNLLFEFSINYEVLNRNHDDKVKYSRILNGLKYIEYRSERDNLIFLLSRILNPGTVVLCDYPEIGKILISAGHHIANAIEKPDLVIYMDGRENQEIIIKDGSMLISENFLASKANIYTVEIQ
ncbi:chorismate mutase [Ferroplasma acidiphilum]|uniref:Chorismate mutase domain-containing protein n=1 Tax=Ferroplasma acidiphilum TaxID=74969 RepID=A0A7K4FN57_9ARCH|nr:hypothetical protein [Ferroplasma acidiphilum]